MRASHQGVAQAMTKPDTARSMGCLVFVVILVAILIASFVIDVWRG